jgi:long-chain acyl-CoA synthetase
MAGYKNLPEATAQTIADGWLKTGDMGFLDGDGYLTITDRKKDLIKTSGGKYVAPLPIEAQLQADRYVRSALVLGDERPYVIALIVPDWEALSADLGLVGDPAALAGDAKVRAHFQAVVDACNHELASWETVKRFILLPSDFSEESGELTPTFKPKRRVIMQRHEAEIEALYAVPREAVS